MASIIEVATEESLVAIRSKLAASPERDVILVVPRGTHSLRTPVGAKILARAVLDHRLRMAVVTRDGQIGRYARQAGLSVFGTVKQAGGARRWRTPPNPEREARPEAPVGPSPTSRSWSEHLLVLMLALILLGAVGVGSALLIPKGVVIVRPDRKTLAVEVRVAVLPDLDSISYEQVAISGRTVRTVVQGTWSQPTTSRKDVPDQPAKGIVLFINQRSAPVTLPAGTVVSTGSGAPVRFRTTEEAQLPGQRGASVAVPIEAVDPGPQGNVGPYLINTVQGPIAPHVSVINELPTEGGTVRQAGVVTEADRERLRLALLQRLESEAHRAIQDQLEPNQLAARETLRLVRVFGEGYDRLLGEAAEQLTVTLRAEYEETAFSALDANHMALAGLEGAVPDGYRLLAEGLSFAVTAWETDEAGNLFVSLSAQGTACAELDRAAIRSLVLGRQVDEARQLLNETLPLAEPAVVRVSPGWADALPRVGFRVRVDIWD